jgi:transcriptional regulator with XRE-family HTH domain
MRWENEIEKLKTKALNKKISFSEIARRANLSRQYVSVFFSCKHEPRAKTINKIKSTLF